MGAERRSFVQRRLRILLPLRHRDFRLLWIGMTVSLLGDGIMTIALAWQAYEISNVATAFSMVMFAMAVPQVVLLLVGGAVSDRFERRKVMVFADAIRMVAVFALGLLAVGGHLEIWHMMALAALYGAGTAFFGPAFDAIVPDLVPEDELPAANALDQFVRPAAFRMVGPALGGALIAIFGTPGDAFLVDGVTFSVSIACLVLMRRRRVEDDEERGSMVTEIAEGFRYVRTQTWLWGTFLAATIAYLIFWGPDEVLLPFIVKEEMGGSPSDLGFILAMGGVGAMLAAIVMGNREMPRRHMTFMYGVWTVSTLGVAGYGIATQPWQAMVFCFAFNALESAGLIVWTTTKQRLVPGRLLGRVSSFDWFISIGLVPLSYALTGPIAAALGARATLIAAGLLGGAVTFAFLFLPGMRDIERRGVLAGVHLDGSVETALEAQAQPGAMPPSDAIATVTAEHLEPPDADAPVAGETAGVGHHLDQAEDPVVAASFQTLADLRAAIDRWRASRVAVTAELEVLELDEARLEAELGRVRERLATLRALHDDLGAARSDVPSHLAAG